MADTAAASERLRAFVRDRIKPGGRHYQRGNAARLAAFLSEHGFGEDAAWLSAYADPEAKPRRNADIDLALAMCRFYELDLHDFFVGGPRLSRTGSTIAGSTKGDPADVPASRERHHLREIAALRTRITRLEIALHQTRDAAREILRHADVVRQSRTPAKRRA